MTTTEVVLVDGSPLATAKEFEPIIESRIGDLTELLEGTDISPARFVKSAVHALARHPDVMKCTKKSILLAVLEAAEMGLEPTGAYGGAHLVPYGTECKLLVDYRGFIKMALRSGQVSIVQAALVYGEDVFDYELGTTPFVKHIPALVRDANSRVSHVYAIYWLPAGQSSFVVLSHAEVEAIRRFSSARDHKAWVESWGEMAKKSAIRRLFKLYPVAVTPQMAAALEREDQIEGQPVADRPASAPSTRREGLVAALTGADPTAAPLGDENGATASAEPQPATAGPQALPDDGLPAMPEKP